MNYFTIPFVVIGVILSAHGYSQNQTEATQKSESASVVETPKSKLEKEATNAKQLQILSVDASKTYNNNTRTSYATLNRVVDEKTAQLLGEKMETYSHIQRFSFFNKGDYSQIMFTAEGSLSDEAIVEILNREVAALPVISAGTEDQASKKEFNNKERIDVNRIEKNQLKKNRNQ